VGLKGCLYCWKYDLYDVSKSTTGSKVSSKEMKFETDYYAYKYYGWYF
jgi:hypothetical protein